MIINKYINTVDSFVIILAVSNENIEEIPVVKLNHSIKAFVFG